MPIANLNGKNVLFVHIPKTGGETVEHYLQEHITSRRMMSFLSRPNKSILPCTPQHFHAEILHTFFRPHFFEYGFAVIREPIARAISEYKMRVRRQFWAKKDFPSFGEWWDDTRRIYANDPFILDNHIRPQHEFVVKNLAQKFEVLHFETGVIANILHVHEQLGLPFRDLGIHRQNSPKIPISIDKHCFESLADFYNVDLTTFSYDISDLREKYLALANKH